MSPKVFEGPLEDICVAADSYGNHERPCILDLLDYFEELDRARVPWNQPIRLRVTVEILPAPEKP